MDTGRAMKVWDKGKGREEKKEETRGEKQNVAVLVRNLPLQTHVDVPNAENE